MDHTLNVLQMDKLVSKNRIPLYDYHACAERINTKLGYNIRDVLGKFIGNKENCDNIEYRDWWRFLLEHRNINNPCNIFIGSDLLECGNEWQNIITQAFINEFGDNTEYYVSW